MQKQFNRPTHLMKHIEKRQQKEYKNEFKAIIFLDLWPMYNLLSQMGTNKDFSCKELLILFSV